MQLEGWHSNTMSSFYNPKVTLHKVMICEICGYRSGAADGLVRYDAV